MKLDLRKLVRVAFPQVQSSRINIHRFAICGGGDKEGDESVASVFLRNVYRDEILSWLLSIREYSTECAMWRKLATYEP